MKNIVSIRDLSKDFINDLIGLSFSFQDKKQNICLNDKIMATVFFEASTRTKLSFTSAALRLSMKVFDFNKTSSSIKKGESFIDTIRMLNNYADIIVIRHYLEGAAKLASLYSKKPIINAGDGSNQHPTQALLDYYTMLRLKKKKQYRVAFLGDIKHARTMHSLLYLLAMYNHNIKIISPKSLAIDDEFYKELKKFDIDIEITQDMDFKNIDFLYVCRIQKERFSDLYEAEKISKNFFLSYDAVRNKKFYILHPLPKINEMDSRIDSLSNAKYFEQANNAVYLRMALLYKLLGEKNGSR